MNNFGEQLLDLYDENDLTKEYSIAFIGPKHTK